MKYLCDPNILPTNTCPSDFSELSRITKDMMGFAQKIQLDIADGDFAPVSSWPYNADQWRELETMVESGKKLPYADSIEYEAHLMVRKPLELGILLARAGCARIVYHAETLSGEEAINAIAQWKAAGAKEVGVALLIDTPLDSIDDIAEHCDAVQLMSIARIGSQGQPFDERAVSRVEEIHAAHPDMMVSVDGGISESNIDLLVRAGANRLCVGSAISAAADPAAAYATLHDRAMRGCAPLIASQAV